ncbi:SPFH domain-containing protein [Streptomyces bauhiniae]|uniref:SPFH domain-containing protein n=1 Tax=Streptomyces bauhiniae TaxID=2340725 RepID=UPI00365CBEDF
MFVLSVLLLIAAVVVFLVGRGRAEAGWKIGAAIGALGGVLAGLFACLHVVSAYEVGVPVTFGRVGTPLTSGAHLKSPFTDVTSFSTRPVDLDLSGEDRVEVRSSQGGVLYADVTIKWAVVPRKAVELYRLAGSEDAVQERLAPRGIDVTTVNLRNVRPSKQLQGQIDKKIQQEQATERAVEAARTAKAEAERKRIEAEGTARANKILERSLSDKVLYNQCLDAYREAAKAHPVYAVPCGSGSGGTPVIVDGTKN